MKINEQNPEFKEKKKKPLELLMIYLNLMLEGNSFKDSFAIFVYMLGIPIRILKRMFNIHPKPKYFFAEIAVGANIGKYSVIVSRQLKDKGKVISIEASEDIFKILKKNIELNNLQNVIFLNFAVSDKRGVTDFFLANKGLGTASSLFEIKEHSKKVKVKTNTLDNIIKNLKIKNVNLIKIDVEGAEPNVLRGATRIIKKDKPVIIFEVLNKKCLDECKSVLEKFDYKIKRIGMINFIAKPEKFKLKNYS